MSGRAPIYGDCYARTYDSNTRIHYNAEGEEIPDDFAGKPEEEGRRLHDLWKKDQSIGDAQKQQIVNEEALRRESQKKSEAVATIKRRIDQNSKSLRAAGVGESEINRQAEAIRSGLELEDRPEEEKSEIVEIPPLKDRPRPDDALGAAAWDIDHAKTTDEKKEVLKSVHHQTLSNLCLSVDVIPIVGAGSKAKNVAAILAKLDDKG